MKFEIPDALPVLAVGDHKPGSGKACIMDAISIISGRPGERDQPSCVHPMLRTLFVRANDSMYDDQRHLLWPLGLRAMGTGSAFNADDITGFDQRQDLLAVSVQLAASRYFYREALSGQLPSTQEHPAGILLPDLLAWLEKPTRARRNAITVKIGRIQSGQVGKKDWVCLCNGCVLLLNAASATHGVQVQGALDNCSLGSMISNSGALRKIELLTMILDAFEAATTPPPPEVLVIDWDGLRQSLGTVSTSA